MRRALVALFCAAACRAAPARSMAAGCANDAEWVALLRAHAARYPLMQPADAYKLLLHAVLGSEHAVPSAAMASAWLHRELAHLPAGPAEPLVDTLGERGRFARVHLRPFVAGGYAETRLAEAFVATAATAPRDTAAMRCALDAWVRAARDGTLPWNGDSASAYAAARTAEHFPAVHHGATYEAAYGPAYRVIAVDRVPEALQR